MERYVWINPDRLEQARKKENVAGIDFTVELSPYDAPTGIVGRYDQRRGRFTIEFEYIDAEPSSLEFSKEGIDVYSGKHSHKLQKICIAIDQPPHDKAAIVALKTKVLHAVGAARENKPDDDLNREVTQRILDHDFERLADAVGAN